MEKYYFLYPAGTGYHQKVKYSSASEDKEKKLTHSKPAYRRHAAKTQRIPLCVSAPLREKKKIVFLNEH